MARSSKNISVTLSLTAAELESAFGPKGATPAKMAALIESTVRDMAAKAAAHRDLYAETAYASLGQLANQELGVVGEGIARYWISESGFKVSDPKSCAYDLHTRKYGAVEVKTSRISRQGRFGFGGLHVDRFDTLTMVGLTATGPRLWVLPATELVRLHGQKRRGTKLGRTLVGLGWNRATGYTVQFDAANPPAWLTQYEATGPSLDTAYSAVLGH